MVANCKFNSYRRKLSILIAFIFTTLLQIKSRSKITQDGRLASGFFYFKKCVIM